MLQKLSEHVRECHARAAEARTRADALADPAMKADFLDMERRWLALARSYAFTESLEDFTAEVSEQQRKLEQHLRGVRATDPAPRLQEISTLLIQEDDLDALYGRVLDAAVELMAADMGSMQVFDPERKALRLLAWRGFHPESAAFWEWVGFDSSSTCAAALSAGRRVIVPDVEASDLIAGTDNLDPYRLSQIRGVQSTPLVSRSGRLLGMISTHWRTPHLPSPQALRPLDVLARQAADLIERTQVEARLRESEERFRWLASIVESSDDVVISGDLDGIITSWNGGAERVYGYAAEEAIGKPLTVLIPIDRHDHEGAIFAGVRRGEHAKPYETIRRNKQGASIEVSTTVSPLKNLRGEIVGTSHISRDITDRKRSERQIATLSREAEHRAKNMLATVQATVHLSQADTPGGLKDAIAGRIQALANVHALFVASRWSGAELGTLARQELAPYCQHGETRAHLAGPDVLLEPNTAQTVAVTVHELATNAAKYGALSVSNGHVALAWSRTADGLLVLRWTETGGPPVTPPKRTGFGTRMIETMVRAQLNGDVKLDWRPEGLVCELSFRSDANHQLP